MAQQVTSHTETPENAQSAVDKRWIVDTQADVAAFFGVAQPTVAKWRSDGMPVVAEPDGKRRRAKARYDLSAIFRWRDNLGAVNDASPNARLALVRAEREELKLAKERGDMVNLEDIHGSFAHLAKLQRDLGKKLQKKFGPDALDMLTETLDKFDAFVRNEYGSESDDGLANP